MKPFEIYSKNIETDVACMKSHIKLLRRLPHN